MMRTVDVNGCPRPATAAQPGAPRPRHGCRVLVEGAEYVGVLAAIRALRAGGFEPWVAATDARSYGARSRAAAGVIEVPDPGRDPSGFVRAAAQAAARISAVAVLPGTESGLLALARGAELFPSGVAVGVCAPETVALATDKAMLEPLARSVGLEAPPTAVVTAREAAARDFLYPAVVKPLRSELPAADGTLRHFGVVRADNAGELRRALEALPRDRGIVQPYLAGRLGSLAGVFWRGRMVGAVHMVAARVWPPDCGRIAYGLTVPADPDFERGIGTLLRRIGWDGIFQVDYVECEGQRYLIDLNPRMFTSLALAVAAGPNLPAIWTTLLLGCPAGDVRYRTGVRFRHEKDDVRALLKAVAAGRDGSLLWGLLPRPGTVHAIFSLRDPLPTLATLGKLGQWLTAHKGRVAPPADRPRELPTGAGRRKTKVSPP